MLIRYSRWDGSQAVPDLDADDLLSAMSDDLMLDGDPWRALRRLFQQGLSIPADQQTPGLQDLLKQLRQQRQQRLDRYDLGGALEDIKKKLAEVIQTEREGIKDRLAGTSAEQKLAELDTLPPDAPGQIRELQTYDFVDPEAKRRFDGLMQSLRAQMLAPLLKGMQQALQGMTPEDLRRLREMLQDLNRMLRQRAEGQEPDFQAFKDKWGQFFPGAESLDELLAQLGRGIAQMQSLLESMSPGQRGELQDMMRSLFMQDERLEAALAQLAGHLEELLPLDELRRRYEFGGDEEVTLREAMKLMEELQGMDQLERQLRRAESPRSEEHTSELQSRENVVCRLLLEKKNEECIRQAVRTGMALEARINKWSRFDRKNYFYADLPQGYQISQLYHPLVGEGEIHLDLEGGATKVVGVERIHVEQDAGKLMHDQHPNSSY